MSIKYRPHRGLLADAMAEAREFDTIDDMIDFVVEAHKFNGVPVFDRDDVVIDEPIGDDDRIGWKDVRHICVKRYYKDTFDIPQCIGMYRNRR